MKNIQPCRISNTALRYVFNETPCIETEGTVGSETSFFCVKVSKGHCYLSKNSGWTINSQYSYQFKAVGVHKVKKIIPKVYGLPNTSGYIYIFFFFNNKLFELFSIEPDSKEIYDVDVFCSCIIYNGKRSNIVIST